MATIGDKLPSLDKEISQRRIDAYSGVRPLSIHTDEAWARAKGFRTCVAQGMMSTAYVSEMMTRLLGAGFVKGGTISMAFVQPVFAGDRLSVHGVVKARRPERGGTRVVVEVWCENQHGQKTAVGEASGLIA
jgi:acyl dehydratase